MDLPELAHVDGDPLVDVPRLMWIVDGQTCASTAGRKTRWGRSSPPENSAATRTAMITATPAEEGSRSSCSIASYLQSVLLSCEDMR